MVNYKLYYFNVTGLGEPIRFMLHYGGVDFEDIRFKDFEEWTAKYKKVMPMGQAPVLEIDGQHYHQHKSIMRYLAKKFKLNGATEEEELKIDALVEDVNDLRLEIAKYYKAEEADKAKIKETLVKEKIPFYLNKFESQVAKNKGYFFNGKLTWADIYYAAESEPMSNILSIKINENYPNLTKLVENVRSNEKIKAYLAKRPVTAL